MSKKLTKKVIFNFLGEDKIEIKENLNDLFSNEIKDRLFEGIKVIHKYNNNEKVIGSVDESGVVSYHYDEIIKMNIEVIDLKKLSLLRWYISYDGYLSIYL